LGDVSDSKCDAWVTAIFVDIRDSSSLFADEDKEKVSRRILIMTMKKNIMKTMRNIGELSACIGNL